MALIAVASALQQEGRPPRTGPANPDAVDAVDHGVVKKQLASFAPCRNDDATSKGFDQAVTHAGLVAYVR